MIEMILSGEGNSDIGELDKQTELQPPKSNHAFAALFRRDIVVLRLRNTYFRVLFLIRRTTFYNHLELSLSPAFS